MLRISKLIFKINSKLYFSSNNSKLKMHYYWKNVWAGLLGLRNGQSQIMPVKNPKQAKYENEAREQKNVK